MASHDPDDLIECRTYTHARRFPLVIGQIGGYYLPVPWTLAQVSTALGTFLVLLTTRRLWAHLGVMGNVIVVLGLPLLLSWLVRHLKIEGRTTVRALAGFGRYLSRSRTGRIHGRPVQRARSRRHRAMRVFVTQTADARPAEDDRSADAAGASGGEPVSRDPQPMVERSGR